MQLQINYSENYNVNQMSFLLETTFSEHQIRKDDLCRSVMEVIERIDLSKYFDSTKRWPRSYRPQNMLAAVLLAYAEEGNPSLRDIEHLILYDVRYRLIMQGYEPSYRTIQRFLNKYLKVSIKEIHKDIYLCLQDKKELERAILYIDGTKFEANANKMTFFWGAWIKNNYPKHWKKVMEIIRQLNNYFKKNGIEVKYSVLKEPNIEYMIEIDEKLDKWLTSINAIRKGRGIHPVAQIKRELNKCAKKVWEYALAKDIIGKRNSFSKTDPDATLMHMKYDYYNHTNVFKPGYNVQIGIVNEYIAHYYVSADVNDVKTYIPFIEGYKQQYGNYPEKAVTDAGYGSFENYVYSKLHGIQPVLKYSGYEKKKEKVNDKNRFKAVHFKRTKEGTPICPEGHEFTLEEVKVDTSLKLPKTTFKYRNTHCSECPMRSKCTKAKEGRTTSVTPLLEKYQTEVDEYLQSEEGKLLMVNRSIYTEGAFGDIKSNYGFNILHRRGEDSVNMEIGLVSIGFNLRRYHNKKWKTDIKS